MNALKFAACLFLFLAPQAVEAQLPEPPAEMKVYQRDVGTWDCEVRFYAEPGAEPMVSKATEENRMLGGMWLVGHFKGEIMGAPFEGSGQFGWNEKTKKYVSSWVDSMSPNPMSMEGTWDEATKTMTMTGLTEDPSGHQSKSKTTVV